MPKKKLYALVIIAWFSGFIYLFYHLLNSGNTNFSFCIIKNVTGFPCPSCGTTRAIELILAGKFQQSIVINPFGIVVALLMTVIPIWVILDVLLKKESFYSYYKKMEEILKIKWLATILISLVLLNWIWNIYKEV